MKVSTTGTVNRYRSQRDGRVKSQDLKPTPSRAETASQVIHGRSTYRAGNMNCGRVLNRIQMPPLLRHSISHFQHAHRRPSRTECDDGRGGFTKNEQLWDLRLDAEFNGLGRTNDVATGRDVASTNGRQDVEGRRLHGKRE